MATRAGGGGGGGASWLSERNNFRNSESVLLKCLPSSFSSVQLTQFWRRCCLKIFKMAALASLGYWNGMILAILNLHVAPMPTPPSLGSIRLRVLEQMWFNDFQDGHPDGIAKRNDLSNSESLCCSDASRQVSAQSNLRFGKRCHLKNFKMATMVAILDN